MIFISSGHNTEGQRDPGAVSKYGVEAELAQDFKEMVIPILAAMGYSVVTDRNNEKLADYLRRIKPGNASVVIEFHFDAALDPNATGTTVLIGDDSDRLDRLFADELSKAISETLNIRNRGVKTEKNSPRGRLGLMREAGTVALVEICFITNPNDMKKYHSKKLELAAKIAKIIKKYEDLVK